MQDLGRENEQKIIDFASNVGTYVAKTSKIKPSNQAALLLKQNPKGSNHQ